MLNDRQARVAPAIPEVLSGIPLNEQGLLGQLLMIKSRGMAERLVDRLNLHLLPEFNPALRVEASDPTAWFNPMRLVPAAILDPLSRVWGNALMTTSSGDEMTDRQRAALLHSEIVDNVVASISAEPTNGSTVIAMHFISTDPQLAAASASSLGRRSCSVPKARSERPRASGE